LCIKTAHGKKLKLKKNRKLGNNVTVNVKIDAFKNVKTITTASWGNFGVSTKGKENLLKGFLVKQNGIVNFIMFYEGDIGCLEQFTTIKVKLSNGEVIVFSKLNATDCENKYYSDFAPINVKEEEGSVAEMDKIMLDNLRKLEKFDWVVIRLNGSEYYVDIVPNKSKSIPNPEQFFRQHIIAANKK